MTALSACRKGRIGEFMAAAIIEQLGWDCIFTPANNYDLVAGAADRFMRIQVKSASRAPSHDRYSGSYHFSCSTGSKVKTLLNPAYVDIVAFIALDKRSAVFMPTKSLPGKTMRLYDHHFDDGNELGTWLSAIESVTGKKWNL